MNKGLEILMARIDSNPEEFESTGFSAGRWQTLIASYQKMLPEEDMKVFNAKLHERACNKFTEAVMEELLDPKLEKLNQLRGTGLGGQTQGQYISPYQQASLQQAQTSLQLQQLQLQQVEEAKRQSGLLGSLGSLFK